MRGTIDKPVWRAAIGRSLSTEGNHLLLVVIVGILAAWRLQGPGLVASADGELHLYRVLALDRALQQGILFPRVLPDLLFGYGYPLFNFYPPAATYLVELLHLLGLGLLAALRTAYGACFVLAGLAMYAFARSAFAAAARSRGRHPSPLANSDRQRAAALVAASAFVLTPYFLINVYTRGALAEALAMALFPAALLAVQRVVDRPGNGTLALAALLTALLVLTHSALAVFFLPVMVSYGLLVARFSPQPNSRHAWARLLGSLLALLILGLGLSAFFWLPAALERGYVSVQNLETGFYDVHRNFVNLPALVSREVFYPTTDPLPIPPRLGWLQALLGGLALPLLRHRRPLPRSFLAFWVAIAVAGLFLITPASALLWERTPLIAGLSFPWRLLGGVSLATAFLAGLLVLSLPPRFALPGALALIAASAIVALPGLTPHVRDLTEQDVTLDRYWRFEFETSMVGTTSANEYLPLALRAGSYVLPRVPEEAYRPQASAPALTSDVRLLEFRAQQLRLHVAGNDPASIAAHAVYFPGWHATVDGTPVSTYPSTPLGLVTVDVPPGEHDLALYYGQSDVAAAAGLISLASLLAVVTMLFTPLRATRHRPWLLSSSLAIVAVLVAGLAIVRPFGSAEPTAALRRPDATAGRVSADFDLLGWRQPTDRGGLLDFSLYWLARRAPARNEVVVVALRDAGGTVQARWERHPLNGYSPTLRWVAGEIIPDAYALALPPDLAAGEYAVAVGLRDSPRTVAIGTVRLAGHPPPPAPPPPSPQHPLDLRAGDRMRLLGYDLTPRSDAAAGQARPGPELAVTLYWQAAAVLDRDYTVFLHLLDERGERRAQHDSQPQDGRRPTLLWQSGEVVADRHVLTLAPDLPAGRHQLLLGVYFRPTMARLDLFDPNGQQVGDAALLGTIQVP